jgi:hypothetical protein
MTKTRKILASLTMVAVVTTTSLTAVSNAQAHSTNWPHQHVKFGQLKSGQFKSAQVKSGSFKPSLGPGSMVPGPFTKLPPKGGVAHPPAHSKHHHGGLKSGQAAALGVLGGLLIGSVIANANRRTVQPAPVATLPMDHYIYCDNKYRSYVAATNTFTGYDGRQHYCNSPYVY